MNRITMKQLNILVQHLNKITNNPLTYTNKDVQPFKANIGHYHIDAAYSGFKLVQTCNENGGIHDISRSGYVTKRELYSQIHMFINGYHENKFKTEQESA